MLRGLSLARREARAVRELVRLPLRTPSLMAGQRGSGQPVMVLPGFGADDTVMLPLRSFLRSRGYDCFGWGLGRNGGNVDAMLEAISAQLDSRSKLGRSEHGLAVPVALVGWSLGGVVAREAARDAPELVSSVITFGTPLHGPPDSIAENFYGEEESRRIAESIAERNKRPISVPVTSIYSRSDGVVRWQDCIDSRTPNARNIEVTSSHLGLSLDPDVWQLISEHLADFASPDPAIGGK